MSKNQEDFNRYLAEMRVNEVKEPTLDTDKLAVGKLMKFLGSKPFKETTKEEMVYFFAEITPKYKSSYVHLIKRRVKHFYSWLFNLQRGEYPACIRWLKSYNPKKGTKVKGVETRISPQNVLKDEDVRRLIEACDHPRDQAVVSVLYETGAEANELLDLKVGSIMFDEYGAKVVLEGTGGTRTLRIVDSVPYVQTWLNLHPARDEKDAPLWAISGRETKAMSYSNLYRILQKLQEITEIDKPVNPRAFRHACLTRMAKVLPEQLFKKFAGWTPDSPMAGVYVHLAGKDVDDAVLGLHGMEAEKAQAPLKETPLTPIKCPRCEQKNPATAKYCYTCSMILDSKTALEALERQRKFGPLLKDIEQLCQIPSGHEFFAEIVEDAKKKLAQKVRLEKIE